MFEFYTRGRRLIRLEGIPKGWWLKAIRLGTLDVTNRPMELNGGTVDCEIVLSRLASSLSGTIEGWNQATDRELAVLIFSTDQAIWLRPSTAFAFAFPDERGAFRAAHA